MSLTPTTSRTFPANTGIGLRLGPATGSNNVRTSRSPKRSKALCESRLSLKRIIGTTVISPTGFDSLPDAGTYAYTAGAAAVVVTIQPDLQYTQQFYRARPTATALIVTPNGGQLQSTTSQGLINPESKNRAVTTLKDSGMGYSPATPNTSSHIDWSESPNSKTWSSRERIKAATCLSISRDGRFLAVGETGYTPRVLIFSLQESSDQPLVILNEHTFGVRAVAFSPDGKYLASLGNVNDGFLYIWAINSRTGAALLHSSNKCTSFIKEMIWMGTSLITVGTRHVKVWKVDESALASSPLKQKPGTESLPSFGPTGFFEVKTLSGRNTLLGALVDTTFTCAAAISDRAAIVCSDKGDVCLLEESSEGQKLSRTAHTGFPVTCVAIDVENQNVRFGGRNGTTSVMEVSAIFKPNRNASASLDDMRPAENSLSGSSSLVALAIIRGLLVVADSQHAIKMFNRDGTPHTDSSSLVTHHDSVNGVGIFQSTAEGPAKNSQFFTWSPSGGILFWNMEGRTQHSLKAELDQATGENETQNQCQVVRCSQLAEMFVTGDKLGMLSVIDSSSGSRVFYTKAHNADIQDIALHESAAMSLIATAGRDRTVQLYRKTDTSWILTQTMDEHSAGVNSLLFCDAGQILISASTDRTIQIRQIAVREIGGQEIMAAVPVKVISLKASPVAMALTLDDDSANSFVVSMLDRTIAKYEIPTGKILGSYRATDLDGTEAVVMDALVLGTAGPNSSASTILAGISSTDKSVRIYDAEHGTFLDREWGHTAAVTDVALLESGDSSGTISLISTGSDGTIMIWDLCPRSNLEGFDPFESPGEDGDTTPFKGEILVRPPLRKVLSKAELAAFTAPSTPTGRFSPPRTVRRKTSRYSVNPSQSPKLGPPPVHINSTLCPRANESPWSTTMARRDSPTAGSRSPPLSPKRLTLRPSLAALDVTTTSGRSKSSPSVSDFGSLNMATEQVCRTLRAYRKKLLTSELIREDCLRELDKELRMTAKAVGEKTLKNKAVNETVLADLLDQYSERLVSIFDEKLRLSLYGVAAAGASGSPSLAVEDKTLVSLRPVSVVERSSAATSE